MKKQKEIKKIELNIILKDGKLLEKRIAIINTIGKVLESFGFKPDKNYIIKV